MDDSHGIRAFGRNGRGTVEVCAAYDIDIIKGATLLNRLKDNTEYLRQGIERVGFKTIEGIHPIIPLAVGDPNAVKRMTSLLYEKGIFVITLTFPVVPKGQDTIRIQITA